MINTRKITILIILFIGISAYSYGETFYNLAGGYHRSSENFTNDDFGRDLNGSNFIISLLHYPETLPFGWYVRTSFGGFYSGFEWKGDKTEPLNFYQSLNVQIDGGLSYLFKIGSMVKIPLSAGTSFTYYQEEVNINDRYYDGPDLSTGYYRAISLGLLADAALLVNQVRWLSLMNGINIGVDFLHWERGYMQGKMRDLSSGPYKFTNFYALKFGFYFGLGFRFAPPVKKEPQE